MGISDKINKESLLAAYKSKGYVVFEGRWNLNIFAVRNKSRTADTFDDILGYFWHFREEFQMEKFFATVDPGSYWLKNPMEPKRGAAGIVPGQYRGLWTLGTFKGTDALLQKGRIRTFRDNNKDTILDYDFSNITQDTVDAPYGIFLHEHFQKPDVAAQVYNSSAGCVVPGSRHSMKKLVEACKKQIAAYNGGNSFTFTLFDEADFG